MRILKTGTYTFAVLFLSLLGHEMTAQQSEISIVQDPKFEQLLSEKRKLNSSILVNDRYKIQIFYGENDKARKTLAEFKREYTDMDGTITFESPTYKVWVGNFKSRLEAERNLIEVRKKYPYALLIKPNK